MGYGLLQTGGNGMKSPIKTETKRKWEIVDFYATARNGYTETVELTINRRTGKLTISSPTQDSNVAFKDETIQAAKLKMRCIQEAIKYAEVNP
jgi:hypothetical protein